MCLYLLFVATNAGTRAWCDIIYVPVFHAVDFVEAALLPVHYFSSAQPCAQARLLRMSRSLLLNRRSCTWQQDTGRETCTMPFQCLIFRCS